MRTLFLGDIVGKSGRRALTSQVPALRRRLGLDFVIANGENAAHGFGITAAICADLYDAGVDVITTGNHVWDQRDIMAYIDGDTRLLRPINFPQGTPGRGMGVYKAANGGKVLVINVMGRLFMDPLDHPFEALEIALRGHSLGGTVRTIVVDVHGEATSEKMAIGHAFDGRVSLVVGTHSHVPTADDQILPGGTAYQSDAGMCGDYDSVIGMKKQGSINRFRRQVPGERLEPADGEATLCGVLVETDDVSGRARTIAPLRLGGRLSPAWPEPAALKNAAE